MDPAERRQERRPNVLLRAVAGAWHVPAGITFLARTPSVRVPALFCGVVTGIFLMAGAASGLYLLQYVENVVIPAPGAVGETLGVLVPFLLGVGTLGGGAFVGLALALLACSGLLTRIGDAAERMVLGDEPAAAPPRDLRAGALLVAAAPVVLLVSMLPLVGPVLGSLLASAALSVHQTDAPLARRGRATFADRIAWHRRYLPESLGFGFAAIVLVLVPCAGFLVAAALAAGGAFLVLEFEEGRSVPQTEDVPTPSAPPAPSSHGA
jgi:hypothetical protein